MQEAFGVDPDPAAAAALAFIARWQGNTGSELSTAQSFVIQLCELLGVNPPHPTPDMAYMFERPLKVGPSTCRCKSKPWPTRWQPVHMA